MSLVKSKKAEQRGLLSCPVIRKLKTFKENDIGFTYITFNFVTKRKQNCFYLTCLIFRYDGVRNQHSSALCLIA